MCANFCGLNFLTNTHKKKVYKRKVAKENYQKQQSGMSSLNNYESEVKY